MTTFVLAKDRFAALKARDVFQDRLAVLSAKGRKVPTIGSIANIKVGKNIVTQGPIIATATLTFTPISLRRAINVQFGGDAGQTMANLVFASEQGAAQADEHLAKLAQLFGFERWAQVFDAATNAGNDATGILELTRNITVIAIPAPVAVAA